MTRKHFAILAIVAIAACKKETVPSADEAGATGGPASSTSVSASGVAPQGSASAAAAAAKPSTWTVSYSSAPGTMYIPTEKDWANTKFKNEETKYLGDGTLTMSVDPTGRVTGGGEGGSLGAAVVDGFSDGTTLTANIRRKDPKDNGPTGTLVAKVSGDSLEGVMKLADSDTSAVREAKVTGKKGGP